MLSKTLLLMPWNLSRFLYNNFRKYSEKKRIMRLILAMNVLNEKTIMKLFMIMDQFIGVVTLLPITFYMICNTKYCK